MYSWLSRIGAFKKADGVPHTHTRMSGGNLFISDSNYEEFQSQYAKEFDNGTRTMTLSERRTNPAFKMYFDIDILDESVISKEYCLQITKVVQSVMKNYFSAESDDNLRCVVATTPSKTVKEKKIIVEDKVNKEETDENVQKKQDEEEYNEYIKNGIHIVYPFINVNLERALQIRYSVVLELEVSLGKRNIESNPWSDIIDKAPYYNGLKMCGSVKMYTCPDCDTRSKKTQELNEILIQLKDYRRKRFPRATDGEGSFEYTRIDNLSKDEFKDAYISELIHKHSTRDVCSGCNGSKKKREDRYYMPEYIVNVDGTISEHDTDCVKNSTLESIRWSSIRCSENEQESSTFLIPEGTPVAPMETRSTRTPGLEKQLIKLSHGLYRESRNSDVFQSDLEGIRSWCGIEITDENTIKKIRNEIRDFHTNYQNIEVKNVFEIKTAQKAKSQHKFFKGVENAGNAKVSRGNIVRLIRTFRVRVGGKGSNYCCNKERDHRSNTCYFTIGTNTGLRQKCFSTKDVVHDSGMTCSQYTSSSRPLNDSLHNILFPEDEEKKKGPMDIYKIGLSSGISTKPTKRPGNTKNNHSLKKSKGKKRDKWSDAAGRQL